MNAPVNLVLLGPPGAGKGTQARMLSDEFGCIQLSTGDLLREAIADDSPAGLAAKKVMESGELVSDDIVLSVLGQRLAKRDIGQGVIFDGYPRSLNQAEALQSVLSEKGMKLDAVISLDVDDEAMVERISGRFTCSECGEGYHERHKPPANSDRCDKCGSEEFTRRADDNAETVKERLKAYHRETAPLISYYRDLGLLKAADAMGSIENISKNLKRTVSELDTSMV